MPKEATAAGKRLYLHARSIPKTVEVAKRDLSTFRDNVSGEVSLALAYSAIQAIGVQLGKGRGRGPPRVAAEHDREPVQHHPAAPVLGRCRPGAGLEPAADQHLQGPADLIIRMAVFHYLTAGRPFLHNPNPMIGLWADRVALPRHPRSRIAPDRLTASARPRAGRRRHRPRPALGGGWINRVKLGRRNDALMLRRLGPSDQPGFVRLVPNTPPPVAVATAA